MTRQASSPHPDPGDKGKIEGWRPLHNRIVRAISMAGLTMVVVGFTAIVVVTLVAGLPDAARGAPFDVIKTAVGILGGGFALLFAVRQQSLKELTFQQTREEASDRRNKELQDAAAEFCETKPAQIAGLHALNLYARHRQRDRRYVVAVLCTYLRMHFDPPSELEDIIADDERYRRWKWDCEIRRDAQRVLAEQLRPDVLGPPDGLDIDLTGAVLIDFDLSGCRCRSGTFDRARFEGNADFSSTTFTGVGRFAEATFARDASFDGVTFRDSALFEAVTFERYTTFHHGQFSGQVKFTGTVFERHAVFDRVVFAGDAIFDGVQFRGAVGFENASFKEEVSFGGTVFLKVPEFDRVRFDQEACTGKIAFGGAVFDEGVPGELSRFLDHDSENAKEEDGE